MGKSTINGPCSIAMLKYQWVTIGVCLKIYGIQWRSMELNGYFYGDNDDNPMDLKVHYFQSNP